jgi:hypothetical protein
MKRTNEKEFSKEELKRHVGAILEEVKDGFKVQSEYSKGINQKLDKMQEDIDSLRIEIRDTKLKVTDISYNFNLTLDKKVDKKLFLDLDRRVHNLERK